MGMRTAAQHRLAGARERLTKALTAPIPWLQAALATLDDARETLLRASPRWRANDARLPSAAPGPVRATRGCGTPRGGAARGSPSRPWSAWRRQVRQWDPARQAHELGQAGAWAHRVVEHA
jgi:hypothetical protein